jgi:catalase
MLSHKGTNWKEHFLNEQGKTEEGSRDKEQVFYDSISSRIREVVLHFAKNNGSPMRANHAKIIGGFTNAVFSISTNLSKDFQVGFLIPGKTYKTTVRFSNANGAFIDDDSKPDLRGVALRIETEVGYHDFLMTNAEEHHARDAREAIIAIQAGVEKDIIANKIPGDLPPEDAIAGLIGALPFLIKHLGLKTAWRIAQTLKKQMKTPVESVLNETFWSRAPIAIGQNFTSENSIALKYRLAPTTTKSENPIPEKDLAKKLEAELSSHDAKFFFQVQRFQNEIDTPIEDATKAWNSEFETIAELVIPKNSQLQNELVDQIKFNPWNIDRNHFLPIGSMNRSRKKAYDASVQARTQSS